MTTDTPEEVRSLARKLASQKLLRDRRPSLNTDAAMIAEGIMADRAARPAPPSEDEGGAVACRWRWKSGGHWAFCDVAPAYRVEERDIEPLYARPDPALAALRAELVEETGSRDIADMVDMALVGHAVMEEIHRGGWSWNSSPAEVLVDLANKLTAAEAALAGRDAELARAVEDERKAVVAILANRARYFDDAPSHRTWEDAARSYRATIDEIEDDAIRRADHRSRNSTDGGAK